MVPVLYKVCNAPDPSHPLTPPHTSQLTNSWPLVFGITAAHYLVGAGIWTMWVGDSALPEDDLGVDPGPPRLLPE